MVSINTLHPEVRKLKWSNESAPHQETFCFDMERPRLRLPYKTNPAAPAHRKIEEEQLKMARTTITHERPTVNPLVKDSLQIYIAKKVQKKKKQEEKLEKYQKQKMENKKIIEDSSLDAIKGQINETELKLTYLKDEKTKLFGKLKMVLNEEEKQRKKEESKANCTTKSAKPKNVQLQTQSSFQQTVSSTQCQLPDQRSSPVRPIPTSSFMINNSAYGSLYTSASGSHTKQYYDYGLPISVKEEDPHSSLHRERPHMQPTTSSMHTMNHAPFLPSTIQEVIRDRSIIPAPRRDWIPTFHSSQNTRELAGVCHHDHAPPSVAPREIAEQGYLAPPYIPNPINNRETTIQYSQPSRKDQTKMDAHHKLGYYRV